MPFVGQGEFLVGGELVVRVGGNGHGRGGTAEAVPDTAIVLSAANKDADGFVVVVAAEHVIDQGYVEVELAGVLGLELAGLEFDDHVAR